MHLELRLWQDSDPEVSATTQALAEPFREEQFHQRNLNGDLGRRAACGHATEGKEPFSRLLAQPIQQPGSKSSAERDCNNSSHESTWGECRAL